jgi:hypothetical protein
MSYAFQLSEIKTLPSYNRAFRLPSSTENLSGPSVWCIYEPQDQQILAVSSMT